VNKLYHKSVLSGLRFPDVSAYEDDFFTCRALYNCNKLVSTTNAKYNYYQTKSNSVMRGSFNRKKLSIVWVLKENMEFLEKKVPKDIFKIVQYNYYGRLLYCYSMIFVNGLNDCNDYKKQIEEEVKQNIKLILSLPKSGLQLKAVLFYSSTKLYVKIYKIYNKLRTGNM